MKQNIQLFILPPFVLPPFNSKSRTIINDSDIDNAFESIYTMVISNIQKYESVKKHGWCDNVGGGVGSLGGMHLSVRGSKCQVRFFIVV